MDKRYQVFVSSTYVDLQEERQSVLQTLMEMDCIPAGMELFPASDEEQWEFIKRIIDDCDYYLLIIGGRYGSTADDGLSYTEKEFDYAVSKGIKVIALLHKSPDELPRAKSENDESNYQKLQDFRDKVSDGRLIRFWNNPAQLPGEVSLSLNKTMKMFPAIGWVRADSTASPELLAEINELRKENNKLSMQLSESNSPSTLIPEAEMANFDSKIMLKGDYSIYAQSFNHDTRYSNWSKETTWEELFSTISPFLVDSPYETSISEFIASQYSGIDTNNYNISSLLVDTQVLFTIRIQFLALNLISINNDDAVSKWELTGLGSQKMLETRVVRISE
ncbi:DUF4062 domain-containing protein [Pseudoalteromonas distincta]|uniref:DUF4062 domain-containing protein n=1 Tax=Pseudoalteromonas distincta TaxID=77608 RepID=A0A4P9J180_9GAMM|nr:DUF4062 domain-containing protein [Pseudoalteromonas distincta]QCU74344.1 DUF4062 domain-containing protein [Pseudoalteromonas distincta]